MLGEDELRRDVPGKHGLPGSVLGGDDLPETVLDEASLELCLKKTSLELDLVIKTFLDLYLMKKNCPEPDEDDLPGFVLGEDYLPGAALGEGGLLGALFGQESSLEKRR